MSIHNQFSKYVRRVAEKKKHFRRRLVLESLEDRCLLAVGDLDTTFGNGGVATAEFFSNISSFDQAFSVALQIDGKFVAAGLSGTGGGVVSRHLPTGSLDNSFGQRGLTTVPGVVRDVVALPNGQIIVVGDTNSNDSDIFLARLQPDGLLDQTFGSLGVTYLSFGAYDDDSYAVAVQADGKIVVGGSTRSTSSSPYDFAIARFTSQGILDGSFGTGGKVVTNIAPNASSGNDYLYSVAVQSDGRIVAAGTSYVGTNYDLAFSRYLSDGSLDSSFGLGGKATFAAGSWHDQVSKVDVQPDGMIVGVGSIELFGSGSSRDFAAVRLLTNGSLDTSFGNLGISTIDVSSGSSFGTYDHATSAVFQADGKLVIAGRAGSLSSGDFAAIRLATNGVLDTSFGTNGIRILSIGSGADSANDIAIQADGTLLIVGQSRNSQGNDDFAFVELNSSGSNVPTFGSSGIVLPNINLSTDISFGSIAQDDGKIVQVGSSNSGTKSDFAIARWTTSGTLDSSFGNGGVVTTSFGPQPSEAKAVAIQADGKTVVVGYGSNTNNYDFALARYNIDGTTDTNFNSIGRVVTPIGTGIDYAEAVLIQPDQKIVVAGSTSNGSNFNFALVRYNSDGTLDETFGNLGLAIAELTPFNDKAYSVHLQPDGKLLVVGIANRGNNSVPNDDFAIARFTATGALDSTFDGDGITYVDIGGLYDSFAGSVLDTAGRVVLIGTRQTASSSDVAVARITPTGALDASFGVNGMVRTTWGTNDRGSGIAIQSDGMIVATGVTANGIGIARYLTNGNLDSSFSFDGKQVYQLPVAPQSYTDNVLSLNDGNIAITGSTYDGRYNRDFFVSKIVGTLPNSAPIARPDHIVVSQNATEYVIAAVVVNDSDPDGDALSIFSHTQGVNGVVYVLGGDSRLAYRPVAGFQGTDSFTYTIHDAGGLSTQTTVTVTVAANSIVVEPDSATFATDLQTAVTTASQASQATQVVINVNSSNIAAVANAIRNIVATSPTNVVLATNNGDYSGLSIAANPNVHVIVDGLNGQITLRGASPALTVEAGQVEIRNGWVLTNTTDAPTILVLGGQLILRDCNIEETTGGNRAALEVRGTGSIDLGTSASGGNSFITHGAGLFIDNQTALHIPAFGNSFYVDAVAANEAQIELGISDATDNVALGYVDRQPPTSQVAGLAVITVTSSFEVNWSGTDVGSGVSTYDVFVSINGGAYAAWLSSTSLRTSTYSGVSGTTYAFYSRATDHAGLRESPPAFPDASTLVTVLTPLTVSTTSFVTSGTLAAGATSLTVSFSGPATGANLASNYELRRAGADGLLGNADDPLIAIPSASVSGNTTTLNFVGLPEDVYRLILKDTITDVAGNSLDGDANGTVGGAWRREFVVNALGDIELDNSFDGDGKLITDFGTSDDYAESVVVQNDGKIVLAGSSYNGNNYDFALSRYNSDGSLDTSFDGDGKLTTDFGTSDDHAESVVTQNDGKIVVAGSVGIGEIYLSALTRYNSDGSLDTSFDGDGKLTSDFGLTYVSVVLQSDGKIVVAGDTQSYQFALTRYNSDGSLDTSFDGDGTLTTDFGSFNSDASSMVLQNDGKIVVAGYSYNGSNYDFALARYNSDGSLDTSFDGDGKLTTDFGTSIDYAESLVLQNDGKIVVAGSRENGDNWDFALTRYNSNGSLDTSFDGDGKLTTDFGTSYDRANSMVIQSDSKIVVAGFSTIGGNYDFALTRYNSDGSLDTSFDSDGRLIIDIGTHFDTAQSVVLQNDGKIVVAGYSNSGNDHDFAVFRLRASGSTAELLSANGLVFDVDAQQFGTGELLQGPLNAFDGLNRLLVGTSHFSPTVTATTTDAGRSVQSSVTTIAGLDVQRKVSVPMTGGQDFARTVDAFTNNQASAITMTVTIVGNLGSDAATTVFATSDGDLIVEPTDWWFGTDDGDGTGTPAIIHLLHGPGGLIPSSVNVIQDNVQWTYDLTVGAGVTKRLAQFTVLGTTRAQAIAAANTLVTNSGFGGEAAAFLTPGELASLANFQFSSPPTDISLSISELEENATIGSVVGSFTASDADASDVHTFALVSGADDTDNYRFSVVGDALFVETIIDYEALPFKSEFLSIRVRATDPEGLSFERSVRIHVTNVNEVPTDIELSSSTVEENADAGITIGGFSTIDPDQKGAGKFQYSLVVGAGSDDNASFQLVGAQLNTATVFDFEVRNAYSIRVRSTDKDGLYIEKIFSIQVVNVNEAPTFLNLSATSITENNLVNAVIGTFSSNDPDEGDTFTYSLVTGTGDTDNAAFAISGTLLQANTTFDFETQNSYSIRVRTTDQNGLLFEKSVLVNVSDVNEAPTSIWLSGSIVSENQPISTLLGSLTSNDPDAASIVAFALVTGPGSDDNDSFRLDGNAVKTNRIFNYEAKRTYSIRLRAEDEYGLNVENVFFVSISDVTESLVSRVWDGGGVTANWSDAANWAGDVAPIPGDQLTFPAEVSQTSSVNDFPPESIFDSIQVTGAGFVLSGNGFGIRNSLFSSGSGVVVSADTWLENDSSYLMTNSSTLSVLGDVLTNGHLLTLDSSGTLQMSGSINGSGGVRIVGSGQVILAGANSYAGVTTVGDGSAYGTVVLRNSDALGAHDGTPATGTSVENGSIILEGNISVQNESLVGIGNSSVFLDSNSGSNSWDGTISATQSIVVSNYWYTGVFTVNGSLTSTGGDIYFRNFGSERMIVGADVSAQSGEIIDFWGGNLSFLGNLTAYTLELSGGGIAELQGTASVTDAYISGERTLTGNGTLQASSIYVNGGRIQPGSVTTPGRIRLDNLTIYDGGSPPYDSRYVVDLNGTQAGTTYDQIQVNGTVNLGGNLILSLGYTPSLSDSFLILDNDGSDPIIGTFRGLPEGAVFAVGEVAMQITYHGGDGNDVVLLPQQSSVWTGAGANFSWSNPDNWRSAQMPFAGRNLLFPLSATQYMSTNDLPSNTAIGSLLIAGSGYQINGNSIILNANLRSEGASNSVSLSISGQALQPLLIAGSGLDVSGSLSVPNSGLTLVSSGILQISGSISGSGGVRIVGSGQVILAGANSYAGVTTVGDGSGYGTVVLRNSDAFGAHDGTPATGTSVEHGSIILEGNISVQNESLVGIGNSYVSLDSNSGSNSWDGIISATQGIFVSNYSYTGDFTVKGSLTSTDGDIYFRNFGSERIIVGADVSAQSNEIISTGTGNVSFLGNLTAYNLELEGNGIAELQRTAIVTGASIGGGTTLTGIGTLQASQIYVNGGRIQPGSVATPGHIRLDNLTIYDGGSPPYDSRFVVKLNGTQAGTTYDQIQVNGTVNLGGNLILSLGYTPSLSDSFLILDNDGSDPIVGSFRGLPEGAQMQSGGQVLLISYIGGTGNDVTLRPVNQAPTGITLSSSSIAENESIQSIVGTLSTQDPNSGDGYDYELISGSGSADNNRFFLDGNKLKTNAVFDFETQSSYSIRVRTTDLMGLTFEKSFTVSVIDVAESLPPVIGAFDTTVTFTENGPAVLLDTNATLTDTDSVDFVGGVMTVSLLANAEASDRLLVRNVGVGAGQIGVVGNAITYAGVVFATFTGGTAGDVPLVVNLGAGGSKLAAQALLRNLNFSNVSESPSILPRTVHVWMTDGDGGVSLPVSKIINVTAINDAPVIADFSGVASFTEGDVPVLVASGASISDVDSADFDLGRLTVRVLVNSQTTDRLAIRHQGLAPGDVGISGSNVLYGNVVIGSFTGTTTLTVVFNANANAVAVQALLRNLTFESISLAPSTLTRTISASLTDGDGGTSATVMTFVNVAAVNNAPTIGAFDVTVTYVENAAPLLIDSNATVSDVDSLDFGGGILSVTLTENSENDDRLAVRNQGSAANQVGVIGNQVSFSGTTIGSISGGTFGSDPLQIMFTSNASPLAVQAVLRNITFHTLSQKPSTLARTVDVLLTDGDGGTSDPATKSISVKSVNNAPVISNFSGIVSYTEGDVPVVLAATAGVFDVDSSDFDLGRLTVSVSANSQTTDRVTIVSEGVGPGQIGVNGSNVTYGGTVIGTVSGTTSLIVSLNANANQAAVESLVSNIAFRSLSAAPSTLLRTISASLTDGDGGTSVVVTITVQVFSTNNAPVIGAFDTAVTFVENGVPVILDTNATVTDADLVDFENGALTVSLIANGHADDRLEIRNQGLGANQIGINVDEVTFGGVVIGTFSGGTSGTDPLAIMFNVNAKQVSVQALVRNLTYRNVSDAPTTFARTVELYLTDGDGGSSIPVTKLINVTAVNDSPVITNFSGFLSYTEDELAVDLAIGALVQDLDSADFDLGKLITRDSANAQTTDRISIRNDGAGFEQIGVIGTSVTYSGVEIGTFGGTTVLTITLNSAASAMAVQALLRSITFSSISSAPSTLLRTITATLSDGDGGTSLAVTTLVQVIAVNDPPVIGAFTPDITYVENATPLLLDSNATVTDVDSSDFADGSMTVRLTVNGHEDDRLSIRNQGLAANQIGVVGDQVTYSGVAIATFLGGTSGVSPLQITFNLAASKTAVQALVRNLTFSNISDNPSTLPRAVSLTLNDGDGGTSMPVTKIINVTGVNDAPTIGGFGGNVGYAIGGPAVVLDSDATVDDPDSETFNLGVLTASLTTNRQTTDRVEILSVGTGVGQISVFSNQVFYEGVQIGTFGGTTSLTVMLNANATKAAVQKLLRSITFRSLSSTPSALSRTVSVTLSDGVGGTSLTQTKIIDMA